MTVKRKPTHPGRVLWADVIEPLGMTVTEAAERLGGLARPFPR
jgi:plasmid maintenance system antidote protein VapI